LHAAPVEIVCVTPREKPQLRQMLTKLFSIQRAAFPQCFAAPSACKTEVRRLSETVQTVQSKLVLVYKYDGLHPDMVCLLDEMLGGAQNSLLFRNVREAQGLCYYCTSHAALLKSALVIDCGVCGDRLDAAEAAIRAQITLLQTGDFPDALLEEALLHLEYGAAVQNDSPEGIADRCLARTLYGDRRTPSERMAALRRISKTQLSIVGWSMNPDERILLRRAVEFVMLSNLGIFERSGIVNMEIQQSDTEDYHSYNAPMYQSITTATCLSSRYVGHTEDRIKDISLGIDY